MAPSDGPLASKRLWGLMLGLCTLGGLVGHKVRGSELMPFDNAIYHLHGWEEALHSPSYPPSPDQVMTNRLRVRLAGFEHWLCN